MTNKSHVTVVDSKGRPQWLNLRNAIIAVVIIAGLVLVYWFGIRNTNNTESAANAADLKALQSSLQSSLSSANDVQGIIYTAGRLIAGQKNGTFTLTNSDLSQIYLDRASAYMSTSQYNNAIADYEQAIKLDGSNKYVALEGEVQAKYKLGDRKQLIPIYQELINLAQYSQDPMHNSALAQYQANIQTLQSGQELSF